MARPPRLLADATRPTNSLVERGEAALSGQRVSRSSRRRLSASRPMSTSRRATCCNVGADPRETHERAAKLVGVELPAMPSSLQRPAKKRPGHSEAPLRRPRRLPAGLVPEEGRRQEGARAKKARPRRSPRSKMGHSPTGIGSTIGTVTRLPCRGMLQVWRVSFFVLICGVPGDGVRVRSCGNVAPDAYPAVDKLTGLVVAHLGVSAVLCFFGVQTMDIFSPTIARGGREESIQSPTSGPNSLWSARGSPAEHFATNHRLQAAVSGRAGAARLVARPTRTVPRRTSTM